MEKNVSMVGLKPLISVIVPVYNVSLYLERCVNSILKQTYGNLEIILVDDGSTDGSSEMCDVFSRRDDRVKVIHKKNGGIVSARKAGIQNAKGDYVAYLDSDDWIEPGMYEELAGWAIKNNADIVTSGLYRDYDSFVVQEFDNLSEGIYDTERIRNEILPVFMYTGELFKSGINVHFCNKLFKRELALHNQLKIDDIIRVADDAAFIYPSVIDARKIVITKKCFYHYCIRQDSVMGTGYQEELLGYRLVYKIIRNKIKEYGKQIKLLTTQLNYLMLYNLLLKEPQTVIRIKKGTVFPFNNLRAGEKVILYGAGKFGNTLHRYFTEEDLCKIVLWVDKLEDIKRGIEDYSKLRELPKNIYDKVVIAVLEGAMADDVYRKLVDIGIKDDKIAKINLDNIDDCLFNSILGE